jgi:hypothetical protein
LNDKIKNHKKSYKKTKKTNKKSKEKNQIEINIIDTKKNHKFDLI